MKHLFFAEQSYAFSILRPLQTTLLEQGDEVVWFLFDLPETMLNEGERSLSTICDVKEYAPDSVICPGNWVPDSFPGLKTQIFHGFGIEKKGHFKIRGMFDLYCTHGPITTDWFAGQAKNLGYFDVVETGWPKLDTWIDYIDERDALSTPVKLLFAPTFSPSLTAAPDLFEVWKQIAAAGKYEVSVKFHPMMDLAVIDTYKSLECETFKILSDADILPAMSAADIIISDTSSVITEGLFLAKPILTYKTIAKGDHIVNFTNPSDLIDLLEEISTDYPAAKVRGDDFVKNMHPYRDGKSSLRVRQAIIDQLAKPNLGVRRHPVNLFRKLKIRQKMKPYL